MRPATDDVKAVVDGWSPTSNIRRADLYTFTLEGGEVLRFSGFQCGLRAPAPNTTAPLYTFPLGPPLKRNGVKEQIGVQVSELEIEVYAGPDDLLALGSTITWQKALWGGIFDGAACALWRAYVVPPLTVIGTSSRFFGEVGDVEFGRTRPVIRVKSMMHRLNNTMPKRLFQSACGLDYGLPGCDVDRENGLAADGTPNGLGAVTIACLGGSDQTRILTSFVPSTADDFDNGRITGVSGANAGYSRSLRQLDAGVVSLFHPWLFPVVVGDAFKLLSGCPHTETGCLRRGNSDRYGGFPWIPPPESAI